MSKPESNLRILDHDYYMDGGTLRITTNKGIFYIDGRLTSLTKGAVFDDYPDRGIRVPNEVANEIIELVKSTPLR